MPTLAGYLASDARQMPVPSISVDLGGQPGVPALVCTREPALPWGAPGAPGSVLIAHGAKQGTNHGQFGAVLFERILVLPRKKDVGFILSDTTIPVEVWNTHQSSAANLTGLPITGPGGLTMTGPTAMAYGPGQSQVYTGSLLGPGDATIQNLATWTFTGESGADLAVTGTRIMMFPHRPDWSEPPRKRVSWLTELLPGYDGSEQRRSLRTRPRYGLTYRVLTTDPLETASLEALLYGWQARQFGVPFWPETTLLLTDISIGDLAVLADTSNRPSFEVGGMVLVWTSYNTWEAFQVAGVGAGSIQIGSRATKAWKAGARVVPVRRGRLQPIQALGSPTNWLRDGTFSFSCEAV